MNRSLKMFLVLSMVVFSATAGYSQGWWWWSPTPDAPTDFHVTINPNPNGSIVAYWDAVSGSNFVQLGIDGMLFITARESSGSVSVNGAAISLNPAVAHHFTLIAYGYGRASAAAVYDTSAVSALACGEHIVNVNIVNTSSNSVGGYLSGGGSSGFSVSGQSSHVEPLSSTSPNFLAHLSDYELAGVAYPANYHAMNVECAGTYDFNASCSDNANDWNGPVVATVNITETSPGSFSCSIRSGN